MTNYRAYATMSDFITYEIEAVLREADYTLTPDDDIYDYYDINGIASMIAEYDSHLQGFVVAEDIDNDEFWKIVEDYTL